MVSRRHRVFITGGTGYIGSRLIPELLKQGHDVTALVRAQSKSKPAAQCVTVFGNALEGASYTSFVKGADTFIHLVGVSHPSPAKARQFIEIDQRSGIEAIRAAAQNDIEHFIYLSVAHPAPVMKTYITARVACEQSLRESRLNSTIMRPWYVLGPGHRWPYILLPLYRIAEIFPRTRVSALRLGLITAGEIVNALAASVANPAAGIRVIEVPQIRELARSVQ